MLNWYSSTCRKTQVKAEKCEFHASSVAFLGYVVTNGRLQLEQEKVSAVTTECVPENRMQLQRFLRLCHFLPLFHS